MAGYVTKKLWLYFENAICETVGAAWSNDDDNK